MRDSYCYVIISGDKTSMTINIVYCFSRIHVHFACKVNIETIPSCVFCPDIFLGTAKKLKLMKNVL